MKLSIIALLAATSFSQAQGTYALDEKTSPIRFTAGARYGYDSNTNPIGSAAPFNEEIDSAFITANLNAAFSYFESNHSLTVSAGVGLIHYFENDAANEATNPLFNTSINYSNQLSNRTRFSSRNFINYGFEPNLQFGIANDRRQGLFLAYSSRNSIRHRWTDRFSTDHAYTITGAFYEENPSNDFTNHFFTNQLRFNFDDKTVLKATHGYRINENSTGQNFTAGFERAISARTGIDFSAGLNILSRDFGGSNSVPTFRLTLRHALRETLSLNAFLTYTQDDNFRTISSSFGGNTSTFSSRQVLRLGTNLNYKANEDLAFTAGFTLINTDFVDFVSNSLSGFGGPVITDDTGVTLYNIALSANYRLTNNISLVASYNYTESTADEAEPFEYDRNRYSLGAQINF